MKGLTRITFDHGIMGDKPCIRGMRVTVGMIVGMVASGHTRQEILDLYPYLESEDIDEALQYAAGCHGRLSAMALFMETPVSACPGRFESQGRVEQSEIQRKIISI